MTELRFRLNLEEEDVEIVLNDKVVDTVGKDVLDSWVEALNEKRKPTLDEPVEEKHVADAPEVDVEKPVED